MISSALCYDCWLTWFGAINIIVMIKAVASARRSLRIQTILAYPIF
jgi:hypothetical protein